MADKYIFNIVFVWGDMVLSKSYQAKQKSVKFIAVRARSVSGSK